MTEQRFRIVHRETRKRAGAFYIQQWCRPPHLGSYDWHDLVDEYDQPYPFQTLRAAQKALAEYMPDELISETVVWP